MNISGLSKLRCMVAPVAIVFLLLFDTEGNASCRKVTAEDTAIIDASALRSLGKIGLDRKKIFEALVDVAVPETGGCWGGATGNFDEQIVSAGTLQWNYGQKSLQPILKRYRAQFNSEAEFRARVAKLMPTFSKLVFSEGCLRSPITDDCRTSMLAQQAGGSLSPSFKEEFDNLMESDSMIQVQVDRFVALLQSVEDDLLRLFPGETPSPRRIKWAIDTKVQQGGFPGDADVKRARDNWSGLDDQRRRESLVALVMWYQALTNSIDQGGIRLDWKKNVDAWKKKISDSGVSSEQADLLNLSFLRSRTAQGQSGRWQALTFQRRARIILSVGCVGGDCVGI